MTRQQMWLAAAAADRLAQQSLSERAREAAKWAAAQAGGFVGQQISKRTLAALGALTAINLSGSKKVRHN